MIFLLKMRVRWGNIRLFGELLRAAGRMDEMLVF